MPLSGRIGARTGLTVQTVNAVLAGGPMITNRSMRDAVSHHLPRRRCAAANVAERIRPRRLLDRHETQPPNSGVGQLGLQTPDTWVPVGPSPGQPQTRTSLAHGLGEAAGDVPIYRPVLTVGPRLPAGHPNEDTPAALVRPQGDPRLHAGARVQRRICAGVLTRTIRDRLASAEREAPLLAGSGMRS
jgi:hypothetical protein